MLCFKTKSSSYCLEQSEGPKIWIFLGVVTNSSCASLAVHGNVQPVNTADVSDNLITEQRWKQRK